MTIKNPFTGRWRVIEMELWGQEYVNEVTEGHFTFEKDGLGFFQFGLVDGYIDYRINKESEVERIDFSWEGQDENDPVHGRGYATLKSDIVEGRLYFHMGDNSWFRAERTVKK